jgi:hypothetical protein
VVNFVLPEIGVGNEFPISSVSQEIIHSSSGGVDGYLYTITGVISNLPANTDPYIIEVEYFDSWGNSLYISSQNLTQEVPIAGRYILGYYTSTNDVKVDYVTIKIMEGDKICAKTDYKLNNANIQEL